MISVEAAAIVGYCFARLFRYLCSNSSIRRFPLIAFLSPLPDKTCIPGVLSLFRFYHVAHIIQARRFPRKEFGRLHRAFSKYRFRICSV